MNKENTLFGVIGLLAGLIIGFMFANSVNQKATATSPIPVAAAVDPNARMPPGHPDLASTKPQPGVISPEGQATIDKAKNGPDDYDAQVKAGEVCYQSERYDEAITFLSAANKLRPDESEVIVHLGNANFDGDHLEEAEKWYTQALVQKPRDVNVRTDLGLTFVFRTPPNYERAIQEFARSLAIDPSHIQTLQNITVAYTKSGNKAKANEMLAKLTEVDPTNVAIEKLKADLR